MSCLHSTKAGACQGSVPVQLGDVLVEESFWLGWVQCCIRSTPLHTLSHSAAAAARNCV